MKEESRSVAGSRSRLSKGLLVLQVALSLVLLIGAGLFLKTRQQPARREHRLQSEQPADVLGQPGAEPLRADRIGAAARANAGQLQALPGVRAVALTRSCPSRAAEARRR